MYYNKGEMDICPIVAFCPSIVYTTARMKKLFLFTAGLSIFLISATFAFADSGYGQYGGPSDKGIVTVDKFVAMPRNAKGGVSYEYVDNLGPQNYKFGPESYIFFKLKVRNTSESTVRDITVTDTFPEFLQIFEDTGKLDKSNRKVTIKIDELKNGEEKEYNLKARVLTQDKLPQDKGLFCLTNQANLTSPLGTDADTAQFCIEKQVLGTQEVPSAGAEFGLAVTALSSAFGALGIKLRKYNG